MVAQWEELLVPPLVEQMGWKMAVQRAKKLAGYLEYLMVETKVVL